MKKKVLIKYINYYKTPIKKTSKSLLKRNQEKLTLNNNNLSRNSNNNDGTYTKNAIKVIQETSSAIDIIKIETILII